MAQPPINFCPSCGANTQMNVPDGDNRERAICTKCATIHYQNPNIVAGSLPIWKNKVLLCKRAINPRIGTWTLPAGFMEQGETVEQAAARETWEEARAKLKDMKLYTMLSIPRISQVYIIYRAQLQGENAFEPGPESLETALFSEHEIPWEDLAFPMIEKSLRYYFEDVKRKNFNVYAETIG